MFLLLKQKIWIGKTKNAPGQEKVSPTWRGFTSPFSIPLRLHLFVSQLVGISSFCAMRSKGVTFSILTTKP